MTLIERIAHAMATDDIDQSRRLRETYEATDAAGKAAIDDALICICGYSLNTLIAETDAEGDDDRDPDDTDEAGE